MHTCHMRPPKTIVQRSAVVQCTFWLHRAGDAEAGAAVLSWEDICCAVRVGGAGRLRQILTDVSGIAGAPRSVGNPTSNGTNGTGGTHGTNGTNGTGGAAGGGSSDAKAGDRSHGGAGRGKGGGTGGGMCAILGPSGAGKTTLLDILAGRRNERGGPGSAQALHSAPMRPGSQAGFPSRA